MEPLYSIQNNGLSGLFNNSVVIEVIGDVYTELRTTMSPISTSVEIIVNMV
jgi:hypothetical protein